MPSTWADLDWTDLWADAGTPPTYDETWDALDWTNLWDVNYTPPEPITVPMVRPYTDPGIRIGPVAVGSATIRNLSGQGVAALAGLPVGQTPRSGPRSTAATGVTVAPLPTSTTGLVAITSIETNGGSITLYVVPTTTPPTTGIPLYWGPTAPTAAGPWAWIDTDTYDFIVDTG